MIKAHVSKVVLGVLDRTIQVCGALGYSSDLPVESWYRSHPLRPDRRRPRRAAQVGARPHAAQGVHAGRGLADRAHPEPPPGRRGEVGRAAGSRPGSRDRDRRSRPCASTSPARCSATAPCETCTCASSGSWPTPPASRPPPTTSCARRTGAGWARRLERTWRSRRTCTARSSPRRSGRWPRRSVGRSTTSTAQEAVDRQYRATIEHAELRPDCLATLSALRGCVGPRPDRVEHRRRAARPDGRPPRPACRDRRRHELRAGGLVQARPGDLPARAGQGRVSMPEQALFVGDSLRPRHGRARRRRDAHRMAASTRPGADPGDVHPDHVIGELGDVLDIVDVGVSR